MGISVWLYFWLLDHLTSVTEEGEGVVLGGKPITWGEVEVDLGISQDQYTQWVARLREYPYIRTTRTPYGISFRVLKAHKRFGNRLDSKRKGRPCEWCTGTDLPLQKHHYPIGARDGGEKTVLICAVCHALYHSTGLPPENSIYRDSEKVRRGSEKILSDSDKSRNVIKTEQDKTKKQDTSTAQDADEKQKNKDIAEMIDLFKVVNPAHGRLFQMNPQRQAAERLLKMRTLEQWMKFMEVFSVKMQTDAYCPKATTPSQLESKLGAIIAYGNSLKAKELSGAGKGRGFA